MYYYIDVSYNQYQYQFNKWFGTTYSSKRVKRGIKKSQPEEIMNPFIVHHRSAKIKEVEITKFPKIYAKVLLWAAKHCYPLIYLLSHSRFCIYENAQQASWVFQQCTKGKQQKLLCLPRSVFVATTSKRFKEHGTMYVGIFLPSRSMHAWVIEDNLQTDEWDTYWILYQPLIMMRE